MSGIEQRTHRLHVVQVSFHLDAERRDAESLLRAWPTLPAVATAAATAGVDITVVQAAHERATIVRDEVTYHFVNDSRATRPRVVDLVASLAPDVVHVQGLSHPRAMWRLSRSMPGVPLLVQDHGSDVPMGWRARAWRFTHRTLAGVAFTANVQAAPWKRARVLREELPVFEVLESSSHFTPGDRDQAQRVTNLFGNPCVLWTSRFDANKDPLTMLAAFELAALRLPAARLFCCFGAAPMLEAVTQRIASSAVLTERVTLLGPRPHEEMEALFRSADLYLQTSHHESCGYSLVEALACGTTPLVTDIPSSRKIVGTVGSLTPVGDVAALADAIIAFASRDRAALRAEARARFDAALTFVVIGQQLRRAYEALAGVAVSLPSAVAALPSPAIHSTSLRAGAGSTST